MERNSQTGNSRPSVLAHPQATLRRLIDPGDPLIKTFASIRSRAVVGAGLAGRLRNVLDVALIFVNYSVNNAPYGSYK